MMDRCPTCNAPRLGQLPPETAVCPVCEREFVQPSIGRPRVYCTQQCSNRAKKRRSIVRKARAAREARCLA